MKYLSLVIAVVAALAAPACLAQPADKAIPNRSLEVVQNPPADLRCKSNGNDYSVGATVILNKMAFQCIQVYQDPAELKVPAAAWVQIQLPGNGKK